MDDALARLPLVESSPEFLAWADGSDEVLSGAGLSLADFASDGPWVIRAFHGTTHAFDAFDPRPRGQFGGAFGRVLYFTSSIADAQENYACVGPDLTARIENAAELIAADCDDPRMAGMTTDTPYDIREARASSIARADLVGETPGVLACHLRVRRPFFVEAIERSSEHRFRRFSPTPRLFPHMEDEIASVETDLLAQLGHPDALDADLREMLLEDNEDAVCEMRDAIVDEYAMKIDRAFGLAAHELGAPVPELPIELIEDLSDLPQGCFYSILENASSINYLECGETGDPCSTHFISRVIAHLGFDAIILPDADKKFSCLTMPSGTAHIHMLEIESPAIRISIDGRRPLDRLDLPIAA